MSFVNDLSAEELLIIIKSVVNYQLDSNCQILTKDQLRGKPDKWEQNCKLYLPFDSIPNPDVAVGD